MLDTECIFRLYENVMNNDIKKNAISTSDIRAGVQCMANVYMTDSDFQSSVLKFPNYNDVACRCAYLHKYAPLHTFIVTSVMLKVLQEELIRFEEIVVNTKCFNLCSLGGGPGSDVIGVFSALRLAFDSFNASVTIIDCMEKWSLTFESVLDELMFGGYGMEWHNLAKHFKWNYFGANLLNDMTVEVSTSIASASFVTMVKFVSASACANTEEMVDKIFRVMKLRAMVLFIDNAAGGFTQIIERAGKRNGLVPIFGPLRHVEYETEALKIDRFGYTSCFKTRVTIILLQKVLDIQKTKRNPNSFQNAFHQIAPIAKSPEPVDFVVLNNDSSKSKMANTVSFPRQSEVINKPSSVGKPQKPHSGAAVNQNKIGNNSLSISVRSPPVSNTHNLPTKGAHGLQKPNAATGQTTLNAPISAKPSSTSSNANAYKPLTNASPISPRRKVPTPRHDSRPKSGPTTTVRTYQPTPGNRSQRDQPLREVNDNSEEMCCSCCTIS